jgi:hypothetical protein
MKEPIKVKLPIFGDKYEFNAYPFCREAIEIHNIPHNKSGIFVAVRFVDFSKAILYLGAGHLDNFSNLIHDEYLLENLKILNPSYLLFYETDDLKLKNGMVYILTKPSEVRRLSNSL